MRRRDFFLGLALVSLKLSPLAADEPAGPAWHDDVMLAWHEAQVQQRPLLLYVSMPGCGYCRKMEAESLHHPAIRQQIAAGYVAARMDGRANPQFARRLGVTVYPTTVIVSPENRLLDSLRGYVGPQQLHARLAAVHSAQLAARQADAPATAR